MFSGKGGWVRGVDHLYRALSRVNNKHFKSNQILSRVGNLKSEYFLMTLICSNPCPDSAPNRQSFFNVGLGWVLKKQKVW